MRLFFGFILCVSLFFFLPENGQAAPDVSAAQTILMDAESGQVLFEKDAFEARPIASITKIMTAILAIESGKMDEKATVSRNAIYTEGSSIYLEQGENITIKDLVYGLMLRSGNDAAVAIAEHIGESEEGFVYLMNEKAMWLGMNQTHFTNPHGLDDEEHYSSAYDIALLTREAMKNKQFREISGSTSYLSENRSYSWRNKHKLVTGYYENATGGKTGYTKKTGRTLVTTAEKNGHSLIVVTLNAGNDWNDHIALFEWGFEELTENSPEKETKVKETAGSSVSSILSEILRKVAGIQTW